jgi:hypothetical protein
VAPLQARLIPQPMLMLQALTIASAELASCWQLASQALTSPSILFAAGAMALAGLVVVLLAQSGWLPGPAAAGLLLRRAAALRRKSWGAVFQRQLNPDAAGHARPRAPAAVPAAA